MPRTTALFVLCLTGLALSGAALVLLVPAVLDPGRDVSTVLVVALAVLVVGCAAGARHWRAASAD